LWITAGVLAGCGSALDQDRAEERAPAPAHHASTMPTTLATGDLGDRQPVPGVTPAPKPFFAPEQHKLPKPRPIEPSPLLVEHAAPDAPLPLSVYASQPVYELSDFPLGSGLTAAAVRQRFGAPAGVAGIEERWWVYRLPDRHELWLNFADGGGPLQFADVIRGAETGYVRDRVFPK
jgi:hypothetical protein